jgi:galactokinase
MYPLSYIDARLRQARVPGPGLMTSTSRHERVRWRAPGSFTLVGGGPDGNEGLAVSLAVDRTCAATVRTLRESVLLLRSARPEARAITTLAELSPGRPAGWAGYVVGVIWALRRRGVRLPGLAIEIDNNAPVGAGLASSAALTCSVACALDDLLGLEHGRRELLAVATTAANDFVGAQAEGPGLLAALYGRDGHLLMCDLRSLHATPVPFDLDTKGLSLLAVDTRFSKRLDDGEYESRRAGREQAARILGVTALRDVTDLGAALARLPAGPLRGYVRHVVTENARVLAAADLLRSGSGGRLGPLLNASHDSLRDDYRVSSAGLDLAVDTLRGIGALGARMTDSGTVIALIDNGLVSTASAAVGLAFAAEGYRRPQAFLVFPSRGAGRA